MFHVQMLIFFITVSPETATVARILFCYLTSRSTLMSFWSLLVTSSPSPSPAPDYMYMYSACTLTLTPCHFGHFSGFYYLRRTYLITYFNWPMLLKCSCNRLWRILHSIICLLKIAGFLSLTYWISPSGLKKPMTSLDTVSVMPAMNGRVIGHCVLLSTVHLT